MKSNKYILLLIVIASFFSLPLLGQVQTFSISQYFYEGDLLDWDISLPNNGQFRFSYTADIDIDDCIGFYGVDGSVDPVWNSGYCSGTGRSLSGGAMTVEFSVSRSGYKTILIQYYPDNSTTTNGDLNVVGNAAIAGSTTVLGGFAAGTNSQIKLMDFPGHASWIDMPILTGCATGIGSGGPGSNLWIGYAGGGSQWFSNASAGDICYRNTTKKLLFGNVGNATMAISQNRLGIGTIAPKAGIHYKSPTANYSDGGFLLENSTGSSVYSLLNSGNDLYLGYNSSASSGYPQGNYLNRLIIKSDGKVGIGTIPETNLDVNGDVSIGIINSNQTGYGAKLYLNGLSEAGYDPTWLSKYISTQDHTELRVSIGDNSDGDDKFVVGSTPWNENGQFHPRFTVLNNGNVGVGVTSPQHPLDVKGTICADEVLVKTVDWADFVFDKDYKLRDLNEVDQYIQDNGHLPEIPSASEVKEKGVNIVEVQAKLLQKLEELTLYTIQLKKEIEQLKAAKK